MQIEIVGAVTDIGGILKESSLLDVVFSPCQLYGDTVLGKAKHTVQHQKQDVAGLHASDMPLARQKFSKSRQAVARDGLHGYAVGHDDHLLAGCVLIIPRLFDFCKVFGKNIPVFLSQYVIKLR